MRKLFLLGLLGLLVTGCAWTNKIQVPIPKAVLLSEDRIYTIPAGVEIKSLTLDGKEIGPITFNFDMKVVSPNVLVKQELKLNDAILDKVKADKNHSQSMQIFGAIAAFLSTLAGIWIKIKMSKPKDD